MKAKLYSAPTLEPVSVAELKEHLRIETTEDDELLSYIGIAAREHVESITRRAFITQTWDLYLDAWPGGNEIVLPFGNLQSVSSVKWKDTAGTETTLTATTDYLVETNGSQHGRIVLPYGGTWPSGTLYPSNPITIRFVCGWTSASNVPKTIRLAVKMIAADLYENRGERIIGQSFIENKTADYLVSSDRLWMNF